MGKDRNGSLPKNSDETGTSSIPRSKSKSESESEQGETKPKKHKKKNNKGKKPRKSRERHSRSSSEEDEDSYSDSESESDYSDSEEEKSRRRREKEERERKRRKEKEKKRRRKEKEREEERKRKKRKEKKKKEKLERGKKGAVTNSWGKFGVIRETDIWNRRPEFTAWLAEVKQLFKEFMEDHNTATFPSKKRKMEKENKKGVKKALHTERAVFNDEEERRQELLIAREKQKEEQVEALKRTMQSRLAQAMKEQAQLREEMACQYKIGNFEAAAALQRRLDPDVAM